MPTKKANSKENKTVVEEPQVVLHEATDPHKEIVNALKKRDIVATIWDHPVDEEMSYVKMESAVNNRLVSLPNEDLKDKGIVDRLEGMVTDPERVK